MEIIKKIIVGLLCLLLPSCYSSHLINNNDMTILKEESSITKLTLKNKREIDLKEQNLNYSISGDNEIYLKNDSTVVEVIPAKEIIFYQISKFNFFKSCCLSSAIGICLLVAYVSIFGVSVKLAG